MAEIDTLLNRWQTVGVLDAEAAARIRAFEAEQTRPSGLRWQGMVALMSSGFIDPLGNLLVDRSDAPGTIRMRMV